ncbi:MAG: aminotransferase class V-fold PLP-dependent enzyme [Ruminococcus sp.]|nr:aminotransferase class V-fold PLP-dependent enzyme [Ruminococcus sp.]
MLVNFDNAATTYPKPKEVRLAVNNAVEMLGGNAGRGGHQLAARTSAAVFSSRETIADFFGAEAENVVFTLNCTAALNMAVKGIMHDGGHLIISGMEHNSVARPAAALAIEKKIMLSVADVYSNDEMTVDSFRNHIRPDTKAIVCTYASNVTGQLMPIKKIADLCKEKGICFIVDGAQVCGIIDVKLSDGINILCTAGHKGLYGVTGTGLLITDGKYKIHPIIEGGTGSSSTGLKQPDFLPDSLESGTMNVLGAISLKSGIDFINRIGVERIRRHEERMCDIFINGLKNDKRIKIYRRNECEYVPIVSFNISGVPSEKTAQLLSEKGFCLRAGFHCAALAHSTLGTDNGTVRFAPSVFSREKDVIRLVKTIKFMSF